MTENPRAARLRHWVRTLPETSEGVTVHSPSLKLRGKALVMLTGTDDEPALWIKSDLATQAALVAAAPERFFRPPYVGHHGWIGVRTDGDADWSDADWAEIDELVTDAFRLAAPKRLVARLDGG